MRKISYWTLGENKPKQSQSFDSAQDRPKPMKLKAKNSKRKTAELAGFTLFVLPFTVL